VVVKGDELNVTCPEFKSFRNAIRITRSWANRVKRSGLEEGSAHIHEIKELIKEHDSFLISIPGEVTRLKQAICSYCICRRPYDGFMIGCDECDEWYHGPCIGVSEAQAERVDKYVCMRCCILKVYKTSRNSIVCVIRKWCDSKELLKARSQMGQKHQRKVREKKREIMKMKEEIEKTRHNLEKVTKKVTQSSALERVLASVLQKKKKTKKSKKKPKTKTKNREKRHFCGVAMLKHVLANLNNYPGNKKLRNKEKAQIPAKRTNVVSQVLSFGNHGNCEMPLFFMCCQFRMLYVQKKKK
jgi:hypothetical protein